MLPLLAWILFIGFSITLAATSLTTASPDDTYNIIKSPNITRPGCPSKCGNLTVPYPFGIGIGSGCGIDKSFEFNCTGGQALFLRRDISMYYGLFYPWDNIFSTRVLDISDSRVRVTNFMMTRTCYDYEITDTPIISGVSWVDFDVSTSPYSFSDLNKLTVIGCDDIGTMDPGNSEGSLGTLSSGCNTICSRPEDMINGSCTGKGCCQSPLLKGKKKYFMRLTTTNNHSGILSFNRCGLMFMGEQDLFVFRGMSDFADPNFTRRVQETVPTVLDWRIRSLTCAQTILMSYEGKPCKTNSHCIDSVSGLEGFRCTCNIGYQGNPYLLPGCTDIDECSDHNLNNCEYICTNTPGNFTCSCPHGLYGDGRKNGKGCTPYNTDFPVIKVALGTGFGVLFLVVAVTWLFFYRNKRKLLKLRKKFFQQNGGLLLQQRLSSKEDSVESTKIFTAEELEKATYNYADDRILGRGGFGTVYKGILPDKRVVAVKKSRGIDESQIEQFINEIVILTQVNHRNIVKFLGCCLESEIPLLVYECIANGTLFEHIQHKSNWLSWDNRLRIASDAAGALSYLHSAASTPIIHRDVKSANILLDEYYNARISDFGASRLIPLDLTKVTTMVVGTFGYLDPEYYRTSQLTEKSDVYSFGVVLVELLTGGMPIDMNLSEEQRNLATNFITSTKENRLFQILDPRVLREGCFEQLHAIAQLTARCLLLNREDRPSMKEVTTELEALRNFTKNSWIHHCDNEESGCMKHEDGSADLYSTVSTSPYNSSTGGISVSDSTM